MTVARLCRCGYYVNTEYEHLGLKIMTTDEAKQHFGGIKGLATAIDVWPHVIYRWGKFPPMPRQYELEVKSGGKLKAEPENDQ
jgi:hypothetical protein